MDNVVLLVAKNGVEQSFIFGKERKSIALDSDSAFITLQDVVLIQLMPTQQGLTPVHGYYPTVFIKEFVSAETLNKREHKFFRDEYEIYEYDSIRPNALEMYQRAMSERSGIILANQMPKVNG